MSDGTRDQLFVAFRLASLEGYGDSAEPLPFVADDILVHFDGPRAKASLGLLAEFGNEIRCSFSPTRRACGPRPPS
jgi:uncharacterized protein YhaN